LPCSVPSDGANLEPSSRSKEDMLRLLLKCSTKDIAWITSNAKTDADPTSPMPPQTMATPVSGPTDPSGADVALDIPPALGKRSSESYKAGMGAPPIVQFSTFMYFCTEEEPYMTAELIRIGNLSGISEVEFYTEDGTAVAGERYATTGGKITFGPNENTKEVQIAQLKSTDWNTTLEFIIKIKNGSGCCLGRYLWKTRVKVIDMDSFPTNKFKNEINQLDYDSIPKPSLLLEYFKMNLQNPVVKRGTIRMMLVDVLHNVYFLLRLLMNIYLLDFILKKDAPRPAGVPDEDLFIIKSREPSLVAFISLIILPFALLHYLDYKKLGWKVGGASRAKLQKSLLRKFLNYDEDSRTCLKQGDLVMGMTRDSVDLVHSGYVQILAIAKSCGQLLMILLFNLLVPPIFNKEFNVGIYIPLVVFPPILGAFLVYRSKITTENLDKSNSKQNALIDHVDQTVSNYRLIADYNKRPYFVGKYEKLIGEYNAAASGASKVIKNNAMLAPWLTTIFVSLYTLYGGMGYINALDDPDPPSLGVFLTNLSVIGAIGSAYGSIYAILLEMQSAFPALITITKLMNLPTDVPQRMTLNRARRKMTNELRAKLRETLTEEDGPPIDHLPITLQNPSFSYNRGAGEGQETVPMNRKGAIEIQQGKLVSLVGKRGEGKSTLLKILGGVVLPEQSESLEGAVFFVPSHLRVLHVSVDTMFFHGTMMENMLFGTIPTDPDAAIVRVLSICRKLGLGDNVLQYLSDDPSAAMAGKPLDPTTVQSNACKVVDITKEGISGKTDLALSWNGVLSQTERHLLCLARSLIANPEVLCIHKPTLAFDEQTSKTVMEVLKEYVTEKGIFQDVKTRHLRRPRTCIITSAKAVGVESSDSVFHVCKETGIIAVAHDKVTPDMLG